MTLAIIILAVVALVAALLDRIDVTGLMLLIAVVLLLVRFAS